MSPVDLYLYLERDSPLHRLHPVTKLALTAAACAAGLLLARPLHLAAACAFATGLLALAGALANLRRVRVFLVLASVGAVAVWTLVGRGPTPLWLWMTREGLAAGVVAALRIDLFLLAGVLFLSVTRNEETVAGLGRLGIPYPLCFALATALRLAPTLVGTGWAVKEAQKARGLDPDRGSPLSRLRKHVPLLVPAFLSTIRMTHHLAMSLEARGFGAGRRRTSLLAFRFGWRDALALAACAAAVAGAALLRTG
ncbi:MAG TPA: energy-coupling factor transporter transmembrane component T [Candidatus Methanoperedens sp.]|nr:energy-coupling factor transporter transmembrane component T [Candidatus Methanoperedens sp.]